MTGVANAARPRIRHKTAPSTRDSHAFTVAVLSIAATLIAAYDLCILALSLR